MGDQAFFVLGGWACSSRCPVRGYDSIAYLNRYEGMTTERIEALSASGMLARLNQLTDAGFRRLVPDAADSFIVFEPTPSPQLGAIVLVETVSKIDIPTTKV